MRDGNPRARAARVAPCLAALACGGCFGTPTPLAPGLEGSVGLPHHGVQTGAIELPERGPGFARYRSQGSYYWGQPALIKGIREAARRVHEALPGGAPLLVGDISARHGGRISRHYSHRSGRDVDLLWYVTTPEGAPVRNPTFVHLGADGLGRVPQIGGFVRLDVPRQWELIKALLTSPHIEVQWLFASSAVEALVIEYALSRAEDPEIVWRAENVMLEPADSLPHDDHLHLRIACSPDASVKGCEGGGPYWNWLPALLGTDSLATEPPGSDTLGSDTLGSDTLGSDTLGSDTLGSDTLGSDTLGSDTLGSDTPERELLGHGSLGKPATASGRL